MSILSSTKLVKDVKQTTYSVCDAFYRSKNSGYQCKEAGISLLAVERINMISRQMHAVLFLFQQLPKYLLLFTLVNIYSYLLLFQQLPKYKISAYEVCIICSKLIAACKIHYKSPSRRPDGLTTLDWFTVHEATLSAYIRESAWHKGVQRKHVQSNIQGECPGAETSRELCICRTRIIYVKEA